MVLRSLPGRTSAGRGFTSHAFFGHVQCYFEVVTVKSNFLNNFSHIRQYIFKACGVFFTLHFAHTASAAALMLSSHTSNVYTRWLCGYTSKQSQIIPPDQPIANPPQTQQLARAATSRHHAHTKLTEHEIRSIQMSLVREHEQNMDRTVAWVQNVCEKTKQGHHVHTNKEHKSRLAIYQRKVVKNFYHVNAIPLFHTGTTQ